MSDIEIARKATKQNIKDIGTKLNLKENDFFDKIEREKKKTNQYFDGYIGFFGYEILCNLIGVKIPKQKTNNFSKGIFYKPETLIQLRKKISITLRFLWEVQIMTI